jgi:hypothetical protein
MKNLAVALVVKLLLTFSLIGGEVGDNDCEIENQEMPKLGGEESFNVIKSPKNDTSFSHPIFMLTTEGGGVGDSYCEIENQEMLALGRSADPRTIRASRRGARSPLPGFTKKKMEGQELEAAIEGMIAFRGSSDLGNIETPVRNILYSFLASSHMGECDHPKMWYMTFELLRSFILCLFPQYVPGGGDFEDEEGPLEVFECVFCQWVGGRGKAKELARCMKTWVPDELSYVARILVPVISYSSLNGQEEIFHRIRTKYTDFFELILESVHEAIWEARSWEKTKEYQQWKHLRGKRLIKQMSRLSNSLLQRVRSKERFSLPVVLKKSSSKTHQSDNIARSQSISEKPPYITMERSEREVSLQGTFSPKKVSSLAFLQVPSFGAQQPHGVSRSRSVSERPSNMAKHDVPKSSVPWKKVSLPDWLQSPAFREQPSPAIKRAQSFSSGLRSKIWKQSEEKSSPRRSHSTGKVPFPNLFKEHISEIQKHEAPKRKCANLQELQASFLKLNQSVLYRDKKYS